MAEGLIDQGGKITPELVEAKMHLDPQGRAQVDRMVTAGLKVMFDAKTHELLLKQLEGPQPIAQKIGEGVAGLLAMIFQESQRSLPPKLLIPAGTILCVHAAVWLRKVGQTVTDQDIGAAIDAMTRAILHAVGVNADKLGDAASGGKPPPPAPTTQPVSPKTPLPAAPAEEGAPT